MKLDEILDFNYGPNGDETLRRMIADGADLEERFGPLRETPLHIATRRYRTTAVKILLDHGADIDAKTAGGKTAYAHAIRRRFNDLAKLLAARGASDALNDADRFAVALVNLRLDEARKILAAHPEVARTGNPEEDRLLADLTGRNKTEPVSLLIDAGADLTAPALDGGTPLHQAAWFGQPDNAKILIDANAPLEVFDPVHGSSPLGWATHGSRYSGGADERQDAYVAVTQMLLDAGAKLHYPDEPQGDRYYRRMLADASPRVAELLKRAKGN